MCKAKRQVEDVFLYHQLRIARQTLRLNPALVGVLGGMTVEQAKELLRQHGEDNEANQ